MALTPQQQALQNKIDVLDSSASTSTLLGLLVQSLDEGKIIWSYDSSGQIPVDSAYHGMIHFTHDSDKIRFVGTSSRVHLLDSQDTAPPGVSPGPSNPYQGTVNAYVAGGQPTPTAADAKELDRFPFASDVNGTDIGGLTFAATDASGGGSPTDGYVMGGILPTSSITTGNIQKYPYSSDTVSTPTDTGYDFRTPAHRHGNKEMLGNREYIYVAGGRNPGGNPVVIDNIYKFAAGSESTTTDVGNLLEDQQHLSSSSSPTHGYVAGGSQPVGGSPDSNRIQKWAWAVDANATDVGDLTATYIGNVGASSETHGYSISGLRAGNNTANNIEKYTFASDANSTDVGDSVANIRYSAGASSGTHGYSAGGQQPPGTTESNVIQKFPFATDENATDVGDLSRTYRRAATSQSRV